MKKALYLTLIIIAITLAFLKYKYGAEVTTPSPSPLPTVLPSPTRTVRTFSTDYFTLEYPVNSSAAAESEGVDSKSWHVTYMGDKQKASGRTQTELFDGYALTITRFEGVGESLENTQAQADRQGIVDICGEENATNINSKSYLGRTMLTFYGGCLGEAYHYYFVENGILYRITSMVAGDEQDKAKYQQTIDQILNSLHFTE